MVCGGDGGGGQSGVRNVCGVGSVIRWWGAESRITE